MELFVEVEIYLSSTFELRSVIMPKFNHINLHWTIKIHIIQSVALIKIQLTQKVPSESRKRKEY